MNIGVAQIRSVLLQVFYRENDFFLSFQGKPWISKIAHGKIHLSQVPDMNVNYNQTKKMYIEYFQHEVFNDKSEG